VIAAAEGVYLIDLDGRRYLDGVSSLWTNVHGHRHLPARERAQPLLLDVLLHAAARRLRRNDKDKDGSVNRGEFLANRRKNFERADRNRDGRLDFEEFAVATATKFTRADRNADGALTPGEFATTEVTRKPKAACVCPPPSEE
jgi:hypothetical protein